LGSKVNPYSENREYHLLLVKVAVEKPKACHSEERSDEESMIKYVYSRFLASLGMTDWPRYVFKGVNFISVELSINLA
jgi:hypothetical protein